MLRFEDPIYLYMLLAVPALVLLRLALWRIRKKKLNALGDYALLKQLMPDVSKYRPTVKFYLLVAATHAKIRHTLCTFLIFIFLSP